VGSIATCGLKNRHRCRRRAMSACWAGSSGTTPVRIARTSRCAYDRFRASGRSENGRLKHRSDITPVKSGSRQLDWKRSFAFLPCAVHSRASQRSSLRALVRCRLEAARASGFAASPCPSRPLAPRTRSHFGATGPREPSGCKNRAGRVRIPLAARRRGALIDLGRDDYARPPSKVYARKRAGRFAAKDGLTGRSTMPVCYTLPRKRSISRRSRFDGLPSRNASKCGIALRSSANFTRNSRLASVSR
jgi:hypothetical protein